jgi:CheY-like chemotaxis protein
MKILVIDDKEIHLLAAEAQLRADHELTLVSSYDEGLKLLEKEHDQKHDFDVVLCDLLMPASMCGAGSSKKAMELEGKEMPVGIFLAILAAKNGAKYVAVHTDASHHDHPASACFDSFNNWGGESRPTPFKIEDAKVLLSNARIWVSHFRPENLAEEMSYEDVREKQPSVRAKNWRMLLEYLIADHWGMPHSCST